MRYVPQMNGGDQRFNAGRRPPLDKLPPELATVIAERDKVMGQRFDAETHAAELAAPALDVAAKAKDDDAATQAARLGKAIPAPAAVPKLLADRAEADRAAQAQRAAFAVVSVECEEVASNLWWATEHEAEAARAKQRAEVKAKAEKFVDVIEALANEWSVRNWMRGGAYDANVWTWPVDAIPALDRMGIQRGNGSQPMPVRSIIVGAATTIFEEN